MSDKDKVIHTPGEFQLDRKAMHIDAHALNFLVDGALKDANELDLNKNRKSDVAEIAPFIIAALPYASALAPLVKPEAILNWLTQSHPEFFKDVAAATKVIAALSALAAEGADKLVPKE